ncbi:glomerular parietal epithelial cell differentiation [Homalodisca vitripennis]|nr:glomerular parietal epithelial cell differentiation [Homalodisca vitripennis]
MYIPNISSVVYSVLTSDTVLTGLVTSRDGRIRVADIQGEWHTLVRHYGLMALVVLVGLVFLVTIPLIGLFFCCCRCAGRCGARSQPFEKRYDPCRRHTHGFFLSCVTILIAFGVVCAFVTNEYLETGTRALPDDVHVSLSDTDLYLENTKKEVNNLLITNYGELESTLNTILHSDAGPADPRGKRRRNSARHADPRGVAIVSSIAQCEPSSRPGRFVLVERGVWFRVDLDLYFVSVSRVFSMCK